ncbi:MAG: alanine racemase [Cyanobacteria bacterium CRU_2_1]|nr:alanine racemase [Cyanobacteria bacterium RU_5_0]NJR60772.1 alanine racemase [Cyanobacteria bacterium CRU_2_1]
MLSWDLTPSVSSMRCDRAWVEIDLAALAHNVWQLRQRLASSTELMTVVKADAYGHGAVTVAQTALQHGASWLGVATIPEGIELREAGINAPILLLGATNTSEQVRTIVQWNLQPTICTFKQALVFSKTIAILKAEPIPVHLKLDTGMSRLGVPWQQAVEFVDRVAQLPYLQIASIYSHFATADSLDPTIMHLQNSRYQAMIDQITSLGVLSPRLRLHMANSAATLTDSTLHYDLVRVGLATYGLYPAPHLRGTIDLEPVMQVKARVTQVKTIQPGTGVSYGYQYVADRQILMAVVGIGYADGIHRNLSNRMTALIRGQRVPQIGAITMDQLMLDVSTIPDLQEGEVVTLLGQDGKEMISADDWAETLGTISWEILCSFKHRLPRVAVGQSFLALQNKCGIKVE